MATKSAALVDAQANFDATIYDTIDILDGVVGVGNVLVRYDLLTWIAASGGNGQIGVSGLPIPKAAIAGGNASHARVYNAADPTKSLDNLTVTAAGGGGQVIIDNVVITLGQNVNLNVATLSKPTTV